MRYPNPHRATPPPLPPIGMWLRGVVEFLALARSRWARRARHEHRA